MTDITIGSGTMSGKGVYAARDFKKGEVVIKYELKPITFKELKIKHGNGSVIFAKPAPERGADIGGRVRRETV